MPINGPVPDRTQLNEAFKEFRHEISKVSSKASKIAKEKITGNVSENIDREKINLYSSVKTLANEAINFIKLFKETGSINPDAEAFSDQSSEPEIRSERSGSKVSFAEHTEVEPLGPSPRKIDQWKAKFQELKSQKGQIPEREFNQKTFDLSKELFSLRNSATQLGKNNTTRVELRQAEKDLEDINPYLPRARDVAKAFGDEILLKPLHEVISFIIESKMDASHFENEDFSQEVQRDADLFRCSFTDALNIYAKRLVKSERVGIEPSIVTAIERTWAEALSSNREGFQLSIPGKDNEQLNVTFMPSQGSILLEQRRLGKGSFKTASLVNLYLATKSKDKPEELVMLRGNQFVEQEKEDEKEVSSAESSYEGSFVVQTDVRNPTLKVAFEKSLENKVTSQIEEESKLCLLLKDEPGIWPTHVVSTVDGQWSMVQPLAGITISLDSGVVVRATEIADLRALVNAGEVKPDDQKMLLTSFEGVLQGIQSLHAKGLIHRDIKLENALLSKKGEGFLTDFGTVAGTGDVAKKQVAAGTPFYMAPEIAVLEEDEVKNSELQEKVGTTADIWSIGITLWDLASGKTSDQHPANSFGTRVNGREANSPEEFVKGLAALSGDFPNAEMRESIQQSYERDYSEDSVAEGSLAHLVWQCTRVEPGERPTIEGIRETYRNFVAYAQTQIDQGRTIADCFNDPIR